MSFKKGNLYTNEAKTEGIYPNTVYSAIYKDDMSKTLDADLGDLSHYNAQTITSGVDPLYLHLDMDLLWTNASPTSAFALQSISIPGISNYSQLLIVFNESNQVYDNAFTSTTFIVPLDSLSNRFEVVASSLAENKIYCRNFFVSSNAIDFADGYTRITAAGGYNTACIPYKIYGIK